MSSSHAQPPAPAPLRAASSHQATLDALAVIAAGYAKEHLVAMAGRLAAALADVDGDGAAADTRIVYQRVKSARLLKENGYAFYHLAANAVEDALRRELAQLAPRAAAPAPATLGLVPLDEIDDRLAFAALARPFDIAHAEGLATLAVRLGLLLGRGVLRADANPFRPAVLLKAIDSAWRAFEPDAQAHDLVQGLLRPDVVFDLGPMLDALAAELRKDGRPGRAGGPHGDSHIQKADDGAATRAARARHKASLAAQLRRLFGDDGGDDGLPLIPALPDMPTGAGWRPSGAAGFHVPPADQAAAMAAAAPDASARTADGCAPAFAAAPAQPYPGFAPAAGRFGQIGQPGLQAAAGATVAPVAGIAGPGIAMPGVALSGAAAAGTATSHPAAPGIATAAVAAAAVAVPGVAAWGGAAPGTAAPLLELLARLDPAGPSAAPSSPAADASGTGAAVPHNVFYLPRLKASLPSGSVPRGDERTLDLLSRVFETVLLDDSIPPQARALLELLQMPVLKAALADRTFFFEDAHPARRLVDLLSRLGWEQRKDADDPVFQAMQQGVAAVDAAARAERDGPAAAGATAAAFSAAVAALEARIDAGRAAEESALQAALAGPVASALAQEKREAATRAARDAIQLRIGGGDVAGVVSVFLEQRWSTVLTFAYSIEDARPGAVGDATRAMDDLIWSVRPKPTQEQRKHLIARLPRLLATLNKWLDAIKWQDAERLQFFAGLAECHAAIVRAPIDLSPQRQLELAVEAAQQDALRRVELENAAAGQAAARDAAASLLEGLERGIWLEFRAADGPRKARLAWVSPLRTLYIFSGADRREAFSLAADKLAAAIEAGRARVLALDGVVGQVLSDAMREGAVNDAEGAEPGSAFKGL